MINEFIKRILSSLLIIPLSFYIINEGGIIFAIFLFLLFVISTNEWLNMSKKIELKIIGVIFLFFSFLFTFFLRKNNFDFFILIVLICISTDIGGYIFGKLIKGPKLISISPNKTFAGSFGGILLSFIFSYYYIIKFQPVLFEDLKWLSHLDFYIMIFLISISSQIGDLIISFFKRLSNIKNTGNIIPGHGGLLDRIDGMIFVFPITYLISII